MHPLSVLFINPPAFAVNDFFRSSINPPLNLAYLIRELELFGIECSVLDLQLDSILLHKAAKHNRELRKLLIGRPSPSYLDFIRRRLESVLLLKRPMVLAMNADLYPLAFYCLREAKRIDSALQTIVGGVVASAYFGAFLAKRSIDFVVLDEGEKTLPELTRHLFEGLTWQKVQGIAFRDEDGSIRKNQSRSQIVLDAMHMPSYDCFDIDSYLNLNGQRLMILSARGCRGSCKFCGMPRHIPLRIRSAIDVVDEIQLLKERYGVKRFTFFNSMMNIDHKHLNAICAELIKRNMEIKFGCYIKADAFISGDTFKTLKQAGCEAVDFGIETGSQKLLNDCGKGIQIDEAIDLSQRAKEANLNVRCTFIWGLPGESWDDFFETLKVYLRIRPNCSGFFEFRVSETSEFYKNIENYAPNYFEDPIRITILRGPLESWVKSKIAFLLPKIW